MKGNIIKTQVIVNCNVGVVRTELQNEECQQNSFEYACELLKSFKHSTESKKERDRESRSRD